MQPDPIIIIMTNGGREFRVHVSAMSDRQLAGLLRENGNRDDVDPEHIAAIMAECQKRGIDATA